MEYQLVFQFVCGKTLEEFDRFMALEEALELLLKGSPDAILDGHDYGMGEFNIFIHCNQPETEFPRLADFIDEQVPRICFSAGYRRFVEETYTPIWPLSLTSFSVA